MLLRCSALLLTLAALVHSDCSNVGTQNVCYDERCSQGESLGCDAGGEGQNCRFCGFDSFPSCDSCVGGGGNPTQGPPPPGDCTNTGGQTCFQVVNNCGYTVWPGIQGSSVPNGGGWKQDSGQTVNVFVPDGWSAGRLWARTGCNGDCSQCDTGFCGAGVQCGGRGGVPPVTLAEFTLFAHNAGDQDFYDLSLVDGYNLPITIEPVSGTFNSNGGEYDCKKSGHCDQDLNAICPNELQLRVGNNVVACKSACLAFNTDEYCCRGAHGTPDTCKSSDWPVNYPAIFKQACPQDYSYAYDDHTSTYTCRGNGHPSPVYKITFC